jgi:hypothetical protein
MYRFIFSSLFSVVALSACGGRTATDSPGDPVAGSVAGSTFTIASARAFDISGNRTPCPVADAGSSSCFVGSITIQLGSRDDATCPPASAAASNTLPKFASASDLVISLVNANEDVAPGTYDIVVPPAASAGNPTKFSIAGFSTTTSTCEQALVVAATDGIVTVSAVSETGIAGIYDLTFADKGALSGSFDVPFCVPTPAPVAWTPPTTVVCN